MINLIKRLFSSNKEPRTISLDEKTLTYIKIKKSLEKQNFSKEELEEVISKNILFENADGNIVHIIFQHCFEYEILDFAIDCLKKHDQVDWYFKDRSTSFYTPIQTLLIRNIKFYENNLFKIFPKVFTIYNRDDISKIFSPTSSDFYLYKCFSGFKEESETIAFIKKQIELNPKFTYPTFLNDVFPLNESLLALPKQECGFNQKNFGEFCLHISNRNTKSFRKMILKNIIQNNYKNLQEIENICFIFENDDICLTFIEKILNYKKTISDSFEINQSLAYLIKEALKDISLIQFEKYFLSDPKRKEFAHHALRMKFELLEFKISLNIKDYSDLKSYHDALLKELSKQKNVPRDLNQDDISHLENMTLLNLSVMIPKKNLELISTGVDLNLCIGMKHYTSSIIKKDSYMIFLKDKLNNVKHVIQFDPNHKIIEAKMTNNINPSMSDLEKIQSFLYKNKKNY